MLVMLTNHAAPAIFIKNNLKVLENFRVWFARAAWLAAGRANHTIIESNYVKKTRIS